MGKFIIGTFAMMAWAFYALSGGYQFQPETQVASVATSQPAMTAALPAGDVVPPRHVVADSRPALTARLPVADAGASMIQITPDTSATPVLASASAVPIFEGDQAAVNGIAPEFVSLSAPAPAAVVSPDLNALRAVSARSVNLREGPDTSFPVIDTLPQGTQAQVVEEDGAGWVRVRIVETGQTGWMADRLLTGN